MREEPVKRMSERNEILELIWELEMKGNDMN